MYLSQSVRRLAAAAFATLMFGGAASAYTDEAVKDAEALVQQMMDRFAAGEIEPIDLVVAKYFLVEMKFRAKQISRAAYCQEGLPELQAIATNAAGNSQVGQASVVDLTEAKRLFYALTAFCRDN